VDRSRKLSEHFWLHEFCVSETAARLGIEIDPADAVIQNLALLCESLLEPIRIAIDRPMMILSGYRPYAVNKAVKGSKNSAHLLGLAADVRVVGMAPMDVFRFIRSLGLTQVDQVICEFDQWTHIGLTRDPATMPRHQYLIATRGSRGVVYQEMAS
jgi:zinc D-Ala-D-Ala carboxypeptidase